MQREIGRDLTQSYEKPTEKSKKQRKTRKRNHL